MEGRQTAGRSPRSPLSPRAWPSKACAAPLQEPHSNGLPVLPSAFCDHTFIAARGLGNNENSWCSPRVSFLALSATRFSGLRTRSRQPGQLTGLLASRHPKARAPAQAGAHETSSFIVGGYISPAPIGPDRLRAQRPDKPHPIRNTAGHCCILRPTQPCGTRYSTPRSLIDYRCKGQL